MDDKKSKIYIHAGMFPKVINPNFEIFMNYRISTEQLII